MGDLTTNVSQRVSDVISSLNEQGQMARLLQGLSDDSQRRVLSELEHRVFGAVERSLKEKGALAGQIESHAEASARFTQLHS